MESDGRSNALEDKTWKGLDRVDHRGNECLRVQVLRWIPAYQSHKMIYGNRSRYPSLTDLENDHEQYLTIKC